MWLEFFCSHPPSKWAGHALHSTLQSRLTSTITHTSNCRIFRLKIHTVSSVKTNQPPGLQHQWVTSPRLRPPSYKVNQRMSKTNLCTFRRVDWQGCWWKLKLALQATVFLRFISELLNVSRLRGGSQLRSNPPPCFLLLRTNVTVVKLVPSPRPSQEAEPPPRPRPLPLPLPLLSAGFGVNATESRSD